MNPPDLIANRILELLRPDSFDAEEEKKIKERDEIRRGEKCHKKITMKGEKQWKKMKRH